MRGLLPSGRFAAASGSGVPHHGGAISAGGPRGERRGEKPEQMRREDTESAWHGVSPLSPGRSSGESNRAAIPRVRRRGQAGRDEGTASAAAPRGTSRRSARLRPKNVLAGAACT